MNSQSNNRGLAFVELAFILVYIYLCISPKMNILVPVHLFLGLELLYSVFVYILDKKIRKLILIFAFTSLLIAVFFSVLTSIVYIESTASNRILKSIVTMLNSFYGLVFPLFLYYRIHMNASVKQKYLFLALSSIVLVVVFNITLAELEINARALKSQMQASLEGNPMVGGYNFVCAAPVLATGTFYCFIMASHKLVKLLLLLVSFFFIYFLSKSMYSIALLSGVLGMASCLYAVSKSHYKRLFWLVPILGWICAPFVLDFVIDILEEGDTKLRMQELYNFFTSGDLGDDDLGARMNLYYKGIMAFLSSPIWGNYELRFNPHSTIIEILASIGLMGGVCFYKSLKTAFLTLSQLLSGFSILPCLFAFLFMALTNPIHSSPILNISLWLLIPLLYNIFDNKKF